jgi:hypothetical protein
VPPPGSDWDSLSRFHRALRVVGIVLIIANISLPVDGRPARQPSIPLRPAEAIVNECSYASFNAWAMSAIKSEGCSMPIDSRIVESRTPILWRISAGTPE